MEQGTSPVNTCERRGEFSSLFCILLLLSIYQSHMTTEAAEFHGVYELGSDDSFSMSAAKMLT
jgi:hypothetical protein